MIIVAASNFFYTDLVTNGCAKLLKLAILKKQLHTHQGMPKVFFLDGGGTWKKKKMEHR